MGVLYLGNNLFVKHIRRGVDATVAVFVWTVGSAFSAVLGINLALYMWGEVSGIALLDFW